MVQTEHEASSQCYASLPNRLVHFVKPSDGLRSPSAGFRGVPYDVRTPSEPCRLHAFVLTAAAATARKLTLLNSQMGMSVGENASSASSETK